MSDHLIIALSDSDLFWAIAGSGASYTFSWYENFLVHGDIDGPQDNLSVEVRIEDGEGGCEGAILTPSSLRRTIEAILDDETIEYMFLVRNTNWHDPQCDSDIDADIADCIVQYAVLGRVIFG